MRNAWSTRPAYWLMIMAVSSLMVTDVVAQEAAQEEAAEHNFVMAELKVVLTGPDGEAVVGAMVMPYAMRMVEIDGHGFWDQRTLGVPKESVSDAKGVATIRYPASMQMELFGKLTTKLVTFQIKHTDYVRQVVDCELGPDLAQPITSTDVQLKKGCEVELAAVDSNGARITEFGVLMAGPYGADIWAKTEDGGRRTQRSQRWLVANDAGRAAKRWPYAFQWSAATARSTQPSGAYAKCLAHTWHCCPGKAFRHCPAPSTQWLCHHHHGAQACGEQLC